jgi:hypothetical protein
VRGGHWAGGNLAVHSPLTVSAYPNAVVALSSVPKASMTGNAMGDPRTRPTTSPGHRPTAIQHARCTGTTSVLVRQVGVLPSSSAFTTRLPGIV